MSQPTTSVSIEILTQYTSNDAAMLGKLLTTLSDKAAGSPVSEKLLDAIIQSPNHDQFVARNAKNEIIGIATVSVVIGIHKGRQAWLEDFVVDSNYQGMSIGSLLWERIVEWCNEKEALSLKFTSNQKRYAAHAFYKKKGAIIRDTAFLVKYF
jgi:GNAT superfamily N-acetyltransferase